VHVTSNFVASQPSVRPATSMYGAEGNDVIASLRRHRRPRGIRRRTYVAQVVGQLAAGRLLVLLLFVFGLLVQPALGSCLNVRCLCVEPCRSLRPVWLAHSLAVLNLLCLFSTGPCGTKAHKQASQTMVQSVTVSCGQYTIVGMHSNKHNRCRS
jgi:hypothetical protein